MLVVNMEFLLKRKKKQRNLRRSLCKSSTVSRAQDKGALLTLVCILGLYVYTELCWVTLCKLHPSLLGWGSIRRIWKKPGAFWENEESTLPHRSPGWDSCEWVTAGSANERAGAAPNPAHTQRSNPAQGAVSSLRSAWEPLALLAQVPYPAGGKWIGVIAVTLFSTFFKLHR